MAVAVALLLLASALAPAAWGCAVPHGGCASNQCAKYAKVAPGCVALSNKNYALPETWLLGCLPQIGYYVGLYNKAVNGGVYNKSGVPGTPALNYEKFDLENTVINPKTGKRNRKTDRTHCTRRCVAVRARAFCAVHKRGRKYLEERDPSIRSTRVDQIEASRSP